MQAEQSNPAVNFSRAKIMIVDDDPELRMALKMRLRANQYETVSACDGYSAIALAQKERPNLIILDLGLPAGNGYSGSCGEADPRKWAWAARACRWRWRASARPMRAGCLRQDKIR